MKRLKKFISNITPFNWFFTKIKLSMVDHLGKPSATRINGYILTCLLGVAVFVALGIEIASSMSALGADGGTYTISTQLLTLIGLLMSHHALLFQLKRKSEETSFPTLEKQNSLKTDSIDGVKKLYGDSEEE